jgi:hypothetical protein
MISDQYTDYSYAFLALFYSIPGFLLHKSFESTRCGVVDIFFTLIIRKLLLSFCLINMNKSNVDKKLNFILNTMP